jgi:putative oxidoreductase
VATLPAAREGDDLMLALLKPPPLPGRASSGLLILRVVLGFAFVQYGLIKAVHPAAWATFMGLSLPPIVQVSVVIAELGGGLLLLCGALTPIAATVLVLDMLGAVVTFVLPHGGMMWISASPRLTMEKNIIYGAAALTLALTGPGAYSVDAWLARATALGRPGKLGFSPSRD